MVSPSSLSSFLIKPTHCIWRQSNTHAKTHRTQQSSRSLNTPVGQLKLAQGIRLGSTEWVISPGGLGFKVFDKKRSNDCAVQTRSARKEPPQGLHRSHSEIQGLTGR